jgi:hypothetical protein
MQYYVKFKSVAKTVEVGAFGLLAHVVEAVEHATGRLAGAVPPMSNGRGIERA